MLAIMLYPNFIHVLALKISRKSYNSVVLLATHISVVIKTTLLSSKTTDESCMHDVVSEYLS